MKMTVENDKLKLTAENTADAYALGRISKELEKHTTKYRPNDNKEIDLIIEKLDVLKALTR